GRNTAGGALRSELGAGYIKGLMISILGAMVVSVWNHSFHIAACLELPLLIYLLMAGLSRSMIPLIMQKLKKDPASSATVFITTATDVLGFVAFLGLGTLILR